MKKFLTTNGRFPRSTYWGFTACTLVVFGILGALGGSTAEGNQMPGWVAALMGLAMLPTIFVGLVVSVKRWHDLDKSGWWVLISLVPLFGPLWTLIQCGFMRGTEGGNRFGSDPLGATPPPLSRE